MLQESWFCSSQKKGKPPFAQPVQCQMRLSPNGARPSSEYTLWSCCWPSGPGHFLLAYLFDQIIAELEAIWLPPIFARSKKNENNTRSMEVSIPIQWKCPFREMEVSIFL